MTACRNAFVCGIANKTAAADAVNLHLMLQTLGLIYFRIGNQLRVSLRQYKTANTALVRIWVDGWINDEVEKKLGNPAARLIHGVAQARIPPNHLGGQGTGSSFLQSVANFVKDHPSVGLRLQTNVPTQLIQGIPTVQSSSPGIRPGHGTTLYQSPQQFPDRQLQMSKLPRLDISAARRNAGGAASSPLTNPHSGIDHSHHWPAPSPSPSPFLPTGGSPMHWSPAPGNIGNIGHSPAARAQSPASSSGLSDALSHISTPPDMRAEATRHLLREERKRAFLERVSTPHLQINAETRQQIFDRLAKQIASPLERRAWILSDAATTTREQMLAFVAGLDDQNFKHHFAECLAAETSPGFDDEAVYLLDSAFVGWKNERDVALSAKRASAGAASGSNPTKYQPATVNRTVYAPIDTVLRMLVSTACGIDPKDVGYFGKCDICGYTGLRLKKDHEKEEFSHKTPPDLANLQRRNQIPAFPKIFRGCILRLGKSIHEDIIWQHGRPEHRKTCKWCKTTFLVGKNHQQEYEHYIGSSMCLSHLYLTCAGGGRYNALAQTLRKEQPGQASSSAIHSQPSEIRQLRDSCPFCRYEHKGEQGPSGPQSGRLASHLESGKVMINTAGNTEKAVLVAVLGRILKAIHDATNTSVEFRDSCLLDFLKRLPEGEPIPASKETNFRAQSRMICPNKDCGDYQLVRPGSAYATLKSHCNQNPECMLIIILYYMVKDKRQLTVVRKLALHELTTYCQTRDITLPDAMPDLSHL